MEVILFKRRVYLFIVQFSVLLGCASLTLVSAAEAGASPLRFAVYGDPPWVIQEDGEDRGIVPYYSKKFIQNSELSIVMLPMPYKRSIHSIMSEDVDFVVALAGSELREQAEPFIRIGRLAIVLFSARPIPDLSLSDVNVVTVAGAEKEAQAWLPNWNHAVVNSESIALRAAAKGRFDVAMLTRNAYEYYADQDVELQAGFVKDIGLAEVFVWVKKGSKHLARYQEAKTQIEKVSFDGKLVLDWYTVNLPELE